MTKNIDKTKNVDYARGLNKNFRFINDGTKDLYLYENKTGLWIKNGKHIINKKMGMSFNIAQSNEVISYLKRSNFVLDLQFNTKQNIVPLKEGIIKLPNLEYEDHSPDNLITYSLDVYYNPEAECPLIEGFLETTVTSEIDRWNLLAMIGYCFIRSTPYKAIFWILGESNTGKSTFLEVLGKFFGKLKSSVSVYDFDKSQYLEGLRGKMVNIEDELTGNELSAGVVNSLKWLSGSEITKQGKQLYSNPKDIEVKPKIIMGSNHRADSKYHDRAYDDRCVFINFMNQFPLSNKDNVVERMTTKKEMSGLLNLALQHLKELNERGSFKTGKGIYKKGTNITLGEVEG